MILIEKLMSMNIRNQRKVYKTSTIKNSKNMCNSELAGPLSKLFLTAYHFGGPVTRARTT